MYDAIRTDAYSSGLADMYNISDVDNEPFLLRSRDLFASLPLDSLDYFPNAEWHDNSMGWIVDMVEVHFLREDGYR